MKQFLNYHRLAPAPLALACAAAFGMGTPTEANAQANLLTIDIEDELGLDLTRFSRGTTFDIPENLLIDYGIIMRGFEFVVSGNPQISIGSGGFYKRSPIIAMDGTVSGTLGVKGLGFTRFKDGQAGQIELVDVNDPTKAGLAGTIAFNVGEENRAFQGGAVAGFRTWGVPSLLVERTSPDGSTFNWGSSARTGQSAFSPSARSILGIGAPGSQSSLDYGPVGNVFDFEINTADPGGCAFVQNCQSASNYAFGFDTVDIWSLGTPTPPSISPDPLFTASGYDATAATEVVVPEPATWAMMLAGFGLAGLRLKKRRKLSA